MATGQAFATRVAQLNRPGEIEVVETSFQLGPRDVAIELAACGICAWESHFYTGELETTLPRPIGHEGAGTVVAVGDEVSTWKAGDRVTGLFTPAFATFAKSDEKMLVRVPDHVAFEHAIIEPLKCITTVLRAARPDFGDHILVVGCGFMGLLAISGLKGAGPASIIAVDLIDERLELARELGATVALNPKREDVLERVRELTGGRGVDIALEATASPKGVELASRTLKRGRPTLVIVSASVGPASYDLSLWQPSGAIVHTAHPGYCLDPVDELRRTVDAIGRGVFPMDRLVTHRYGLDGVARGIEDGLSRMPGYIKGVVIPNLA
jgi:threonine dehydrogenase-like Zn-dependent dehydrogenase